MAEVRKEAFNTRFQKTDKVTSLLSSPDEEEVEEPYPSATNLTITEVWQSWYPQEWIGWVMYGVSSDNPTEHWVNQPNSSGPTVSDTYIFDDKGSKVSKRPGGRTVQREKATMESVVAKQSSDTNSMQAHHLLQVDLELECTMSARDLMLIKDLEKRAYTQEEKVSDLKFNIFGDCFMKMSKNNFALIYDCFVKVRRCHDKNL